MTVRPRRLCVFAAFGLVAIALSPAHADRQAELGSYERAALDLALERRKLEIEPAPEGKTVRRVHVVNLDVFGKDEGFLQWFNVFHRTTREDIIEREVLLRPGEVWDELVIEDSRRRLSDQLFTTLVVFAPVKADGQGAVDLLVVTRDMWSLRMNSNIEVQDGTITKLLVSISENNFLGWRKQLAMVFDMDQGSWSVGPLYVDKNVLGTRLRFRSRVRAIFSRVDSKYEGTGSSTSLVYPLWSLRQQWGASLTVGHFDGIQRQFFGTELRPFPLDAGDGDETIPHLWDRRIAEVKASLTRSLGTKTKHRFSGGYELRSDRSGLPDEVMASPELEARFEDEVLPRSERTSTLVAHYHVFTPRYVRYRNINTYDLPEDSTLGPNMTAELGWALEPLGSEVGFVRASTAASWTFDWSGDGFVRIAAGLGTRLQDDDLIDNSASGSVRVASVRLFDAFRVIGAASLATRWDEQANRVYVLGGDSGLRGYPIGGFFTTPGSESHRFARTNLEVRSLPMKILFTRFGGLLFWDMGGVAASFNEMNLYHDVGAGLRLLVPQMQPFVFRLDWAVPLNGPNAGLAGSRVIFGSFQAF